MRNLKSLDNSVFEQAQLFLEKSIWEMRGKAPDFNTKLNIYMPGYFLKMFDYYLRNDFRAGLVTDYSNIFNCKYQGIEITENWDNSIVVAMEDGHIKNVEPYIFPL